jgi:hypothetical protein
MTRLDWALIVLVGAAGAVGLWDLGGMVAEQRWDIRVPRPGLIKSGNTDESNRTGADDQSNRAPTRGRGLLPQGMTRTTLAALVPLGSVAGRSRFRFARPPRQKRVRLVRSGARKR